MKDQSTARLLASSLHEMRNILAVINESAGLARDVASLEAQGPQPGQENKNAGIMVSALQGAQEAIDNASKLVRSMEYMAQMSDSQNGIEEGCNLDYACQSFCRMAKRWAKSVCIALTSGNAQEQVWAALPVPLLYGALLEILDLCASVGGQIGLDLTAGYRSKTAGIFVTLTGGDNLPLALSAMTSKKSFEASDAGYLASLVPANVDGKTYRFFLSVTQV